MAQDLFNWVLSIPQTIAGFTDWLVTPIGHGIDLSPLMLLSLGGVGIVIFIIGLHVVRLFV